MRNEILDLLRTDGPLCVEEISDALMWGEDLVHAVLIPLVKSGDVYAEIDGTFWFALGVNEEDSDELRRERVMERAA